MAAATEPPRKYWLKHECRDGTIHAGASGLPLASQEVRTFNETTLREAMVQYVRLWIHAFEPHDDGDLIDNVVTFEFEGYQVCFYQDDSEEIYRFFDSDGGAKDREITVTTRCRRSKADPPEVLGKKGMHRVIDGLTTTVDMSLDRRTADNVQTLILSLRLRDKITLVTESQEKRASYVQWKYEPGAWNKKALKKLREREAAVLRPVTARDLFG